MFDCITGESHRNHFDVIANTTKLTLTLSKDVVKADSEPSACIVVLVID